MTHRSGRRPPHRPALPVGRPTPHAEQLVVLEGVGKALSQTAARWAGTVRARSVGSRLGGVAGTELEMAVILGGHPRRSRGCEDLERQRRSMAMLTPGQPAGLSREDAVELLAELQQARRRLDQLEDGLRRLLEDRSG